MAEAGFPLSVKQLEAAGLSYSYAHNIVQGHRTPSVETALKVLDETGVAIGPLEGLSPPDIEVERRAAALRKARAA